MPENNPSEYIKISDAAQLLGVTHRWVYRRVMSGELPASKVGGLYFISRKDLENLMQAGRVTPQTDEPDAATRTSPLKCALCYRLLPDSEEIGGECAHEDCGAIICQKCWDLDLHYCARHSPTREQRLKKAQAQAQTGEIAMLVKAEDARLSEINFLNWADLHLNDFPTLIHPLSGKAVNIPSWKDIQDSGDARAELMQLLGRVTLDSATVAQQPLNAWRRYRIRNKKVEPMVVHVQAASRIDRMVRDGFDTQPLDVHELTLWIEKLVESGGKGNEFRVVLLASPTGWDEKAKALVTGMSGIPYSHRQALLYLFDIPENKLAYNHADERTRRYAALFQPVIAGKELNTIIKAVIESMGIHDSLTLQEAQDTLPFPADKIELAFKQMAEGQEFIITNLKGLGITLVKRQALQ